MNRLIVLLTLCVMLLPLAACGKKGSPSAPGPSNEVTFPRTYPQPD
ncbi:hypothetical protein [Acetobacter oeni]|uniref:Lipoprotein n=1 Tax=Acetobacter oeni TaxID=304077 RepID=A0A511XHR3_9PROT|nr:hypothetical protein [Acetobacter oeni]MBB3881304.1 putative small lipoprotein YifL [Acetobacter oeni]GBR08034.1 hypothetical protein AA21952_2496 [Acetobacter oeni LMG 21952]GEN62459.1 hypothetical protein AOE01nite_06830 [Acetobacter oeni]